MAAEPELRVTSGYQASTAERRGLEAWAGAPTFPTYTQPQSFCRQTPHGKACPTWTLVEDRGEGGRRGRERVEDGFLNSPLGKCAVH